MKNTYLLLLLAATACGAPFTGALAEAGDAAPAPDSGLDRIDPHHAEGGHVESGRDAVDPPDAGHDTAPPPDAGHDAPSPPPVDAGHDAPPPPPADVCAPPVPNTSSFCGGITTPASYCIVYAGGTIYQAPTPPSCALCATSYDCACILAALPNPCDGHGTLNATEGCSPGGGDDVPVVYCQ